MRVIGGPHTLTACHLAFALLLQDNGHTSYMTAGLTSSSPKLGLDLT